MKPLTTPKSKNKCRAATSAAVAEGPAAFSRNASERPARAVNRAACRRRGGRWPTTSMTDRSSLSRGSLPRAQEFQNRIGMKFVASLATAAAASPPLSAFARGREREDNGRKSCAREEAYVCSAPSNWQQCRDGGGDDD